MKKNWKPIKDYEGLYEVSNDGEIKSLTYNHLLKPYFGNYVKVILSKHDKNKCFRVHRLVASAFIPNPHNYSDINHKDGRKHNNNVENLEWVSHRENVLHAFREGLISRENIGIGRKKYWGKRLLKNQKPVSTGLMASR